MHFQILQGALIFHFKTLALKGRSEQQPRDSPQPTVEPVNTEQLCTQVAEARFFSLKPGIIQPSNSILKALNKQPVSPYK